MSKPMVRIRVFWFSAIVVASLVVPATGWAQAQPAADQKPPAAGPAPPVMLKATVIVSRFQGEKKVGNLPFTFFVGTGTNDRVSVRMQADIPGATTKTENGVATTTYGYSAYNSIGTSIDATARNLGDGRYSLNLTISDRQAIASPQGAAQRTSPSGMPEVQAFSSQNVLYLRDGQTVQYATATDKVTGEVVKVDVTLEVVK